MSEANRLERVVRNDLLSQVIRETWEEIHPTRVGQFPDAQLFEGKWYIGKWGCDTLQHMVDIFHER
ncbi:MAG: hypothetical protein A3G39_05345 [Deltaproteobacteria bacterium RIFCSPLOWO2_12_FULL_43_16]|nr:MAG: hypothetical protein A2Z89_02055 [Deltaproteobacteria bacterium GWA2_43_19]OGQ11528.1 MAG: hypothetical protein A3D30_07255 [Deltaproteobacteria bacterium RIFCSPHIGHO2_02_FULL_43_33]OGQ44471.1 MAG: hypothetical protein A3A85_07320 [Deltaproteobacteria bacterium RIFCSPLOWO2_01_FULL_42_9]OGQ60842.1 MAG: hypothetical protein A3G39_05345 [Deltaproteobacteria bacterium RIFCSPLOWO2_12_FULL_43_16]